MYPSMNTHVNGRKITVKGEFGLPDHYPVPPPNEHLVFFIQSNQNVNTVVYEVKTVLDGRIDQTQPLKVYWHKFTNNGEIKQLNFIQNKLAYGYTFKLINENTVEFQLVSYDKIVFYLTKTMENTFGVFTKINGDMAKVNNIYVYADDFGLFPDVQYIELYGTQLTANEPAYERIYIQ